MILISIVDCFAIYPTFRKTYLKPYEENLFSWSIDLIKFILQLFALKSFNLTTALFPIVIIVNDAALTAMIILRRKSIIKP